MTGMAQALDFEGKNITSVEIRYRGSKTVDEAAIRSRLSTQAGQKYSTEKLDADIKKLYESGQVDDVRWLAEPSGSGVKLIAEVATFSKKPSGINNGGTLEAVMKSLTTNEVCIYAS